MEQVQVAEIEHELLTSLPAEWTRRNLAGKLIEITGYLNHECYNIADMLLRVWKKRGVIQKVKNHKTWTKTSA